MYNIYMYELNSYEYIQCDQQVPEGVEANKRNIYLTSTSPTCVVKAYKDQFQEDTTLFLKSRSEELVKGGQMVLTYWGRATEDPTSTESTFVWDMFSSVFNQLISEVHLHNSTITYMNSYYIQNLFDSTVLNKLVSLADT